MGSDISRRDILRSADGAFLLSPACSGSADTSPEEQTYHRFTGYGGVGDCSGSNGNTWNVVQAAYQIRDGASSEAIETATPTKEKYDVIIVGSGASGLSAVYPFTKLALGKQCCLIPDHHPVHCREAKKTEFIVDGRRLIGPQGSGLFMNATITAPGQICGELRDIGMPTDFEKARQNPIFRLNSQGEMQYGLSN